MAAGRLTRALDLMVSALPDEETAIQTALDLDGAGRSAEAAKLLEPLAARRDKPRVLLAYAEFLRSAGGDWMAVVDCLRTALTIEPKYFEGGTRLLLADVLMKNGLKAEAIEQWRIVAKMPPDGSGYGAVPDEAIFMLQQHEV